MIYVDLSYEAERVVLRVQDNGKGFDIHQHSDGSGFGLMGISQRVERHGGKLSVVSRPGHGSVIVPRWYSDVLRRRTLIAMRY